MKGAKGLTRKFYAVVHVRMQGLIGVGTGQAKVTASAAQDVIAAAKQRGDDGRQGGQVYQHGPGGFVQQLTSDAGGAKRVSVVAAIALAILVLG